MNIPQHCHFVYCTNVIHKWYQLLVLVFHMMASLLKSTVFVRHISLTLNALSWYCLINQASPAKCTTPPSPSLALRPPPPSYLNFSATGVSHPQPEGHYSATDVWMTFGRYVVSSPPEGRSREHSSFFLRLASLTRAVAGNEDSEAL